MKNSIFIRNPDIVTRIDDNEALLFNPQDANLVCINETGLYVWNICEKECFKEAIVEKIIQEYDFSSREAVAQDLDTFLNVLEKAGFLGRKVKEA
ncbi:MAG: PqqD family protein [Candidatus Omnitrophica bacterium]|nr:PqqD family protein [Candidatus Omnitrophota bacterium]